MRTHVYIDRLAQAPIYRSSVNLDCPHQPRSVYPGAMDEDGLLLETLVAVGRVMR